MSVMVIFRQRLKIMIAKLVLSADQVSEGDDMSRLRISAFFVATLVVAAKHISLDAQTTMQAVPAATNKSAKIAVSIAVPNRQIPLGQKPWVHLTVKNLGSEEIAYPSNQVYVEGPNGEPPTTHIQRAMTNRLKPGEAGIPETGFRPPIAPAGWPGDSFTMKYDLSYFYEFKAPGKYTVCIEVLDVPKPGTKRDTALWVRSPIATFELLAPTR